MKVYISGPITGTVGYMEKFDIAEQILTTQGHTVVNPAKINAGLPEGTTHEQYMDVSMVLLGMCEGIYMMKGWRDSKGANMELAEAISKGLTIAFEGGTRWPNQNKPKPGSLMKRLVKQ